ncbi:PKD domain-containing protein [bacterium]|nr:PKD domain-containing protein [bacterium]
MFSLRFVFLVLLISSGIVSVRAQFSRGFEENQGQGPAWANFWMNQHQSRIGFGQMRIGLRLTDPEALHRLHPHGHDRAESEPSPMNLRVKQWDLFLTLEGGHPRQPIAEGAALPGSSHYHRGKQSIADVPSFQRIRYRDILPGIDWLIEEPTDGISLFKHSFVVAPGADPRSIVLLWEGAERLAIQSGHLEIHTGIGIVREPPPLAYQEIGGRRTVVECAFRIQEGKVLYDLGPYDSSVVLVIDPTLVFASYSGSTSDNWGFTATQDPAGNFYLGGIVFGGGFPVSPGAHDTLISGNSDVALLKLSPDGQTRIYASYLGGSANDRPHSLMADANGLVVMGITGSSDFPTTPNAFDTSFAGGPALQVIGGNYPGGADVFVCRLSPDGSTLLASTFLGGTGNEGINRFLINAYGDEARGEVNLDAQGRVYVATTTESIDFPLAGALSSFAGNAEAVVAQLSPQLDQLLWSRFLGGSGNDAGFSLAIGDSGQVYVAGATQSADFPTTTGTHMASSPGGTSDGFLCRLNTIDGGQLYSTFVGTSGRDLCFFVDLDLLGRVSVFGHTDGSMPQTPGLYGQNNGRQFLQMFNPGLSQVQRSARFGSGRPVFDIAPSAFRIDSCGSVYCAGWGGGLAASGSSTNGLLTTPNAFQNATDGSDFYFLVLDPTWTQPVFASFFGGNNVAEHVDGGTSRFDRSGVISQAICAGCGGSSGTPAFPPSVWSPTNNSGNCNMLGLRIDLRVDSTYLDILANPDTLCVGDTVQFAADAFQLDQFEWDFGDGRTAQTATATVSYSMPGRYVVRLRAQRGQCLVGRADSVVIHVLDLETDSIELKATYDSCDANFSVFFELLGSPQSSVLYTGAGAVLTGLPLSYTYPGPGTYTAYVEYLTGRCDQNGSDTALVVFGGLNRTAEFDLDYAACRDGLTLQMRTTFAVQGLLTVDFGDGVTATGQGPNWTHTYAQPGEYTITTTLFDSICRTSDGADQTLYVGNADASLSDFPNVFTPNGDGANDRLDFSAWALAWGAQEARVHIFNRWGQLMHEGEAPWDGRLNGVEAAEGVYFWVLEFRDACGQRSTFQGLVHLSR